MIIESIVDAIKKAKTIAIISHVSPDGDTVGSGLALFKAIELYGGKPYIFCDDQIKGRVASLSGVEKYNIESLEYYDLAISVDCADIERMGYSIQEYYKGSKTINIDHHRTNRRVADINYVNINAAATTQIMYNVLTELVEINAEIAGLLYSGLVSDSGGFTFSSVTPDTMRVAGELLKYDINASEICTHFLRKTKLDTYRLKNRVLSKTKFYDDNTIGIISFRLDDFEATGTDTSCTEGIINNVLNIDCVRVAVSISEVKDKDFKVSFRTGDETDSSKIVYIFGGGGHRNAAGCRLSGYYEDVVDRILKAIRDEIC